MIALIRALFRAPRTTDLETQLGRLQVAAQAQAEYREQAVEETEKRIAALATQHADHSVELRRAEELRDRIGLLLTLGDTRSAG